LRANNSAFHGFVRRIGDIGWVVSQAEQRRHNLAQGTSPVYWVSLQPISRATATERSVGMSNRNLCCRRAAWRASLKYVINSINARYNSVSSPRFSRNHERP
jgi:hypothetical protein